MTPRTRRVLTLLALFGLLAAAVASAVLSR